MKTDILPQLWYKYKCIYVNLSKYKHILMKKYVNKKYRNEYIYMNRNML